MAKPKIKHTITKKEWNKKHKDFKTTIKGIPYIMMYDDKVGTYLAPVKIVDEAIEEMDLNDPVLVRLRAAQIKRNQDAADRLEKAKSDKEREKAEKLAKRNATKIKALKKKRAEVMRDMEQEAEPEGGKIADRYGKLLNRIDNDIIKLGGNPMTESINEWKLQLDLGKVNPSEFENWASDSLQKKHKIKVSGSGRNWTIVGKGNDDRMGSSADWISQLLGKAWTGNKIKVVQKESVNEASDLDVYHKSYTHAIEAAEVYAKKKGYEIDDDEMFTKVGMNSKRPSVGKTTRVSLELLKNGKPQRKMLHIQVYGMKNGYELNAYIN